MQLFPCSSPAWTCQCSGSCCATSKRWFEQLAGWVTEKCELILVHIVCWCRLCGATDEESEDTADMDTSLDPNTSWKDTAPAGRGSSSLGLVCQERLTDLGGCKPNSSCTVTVTYRALLPGMYDLGQPRLLDNKTGKFLPTCSSCIYVCVVAQTDSRFNN